MPDPHVINQLIAVGRKRGVPRKHIKAILETTLVETGGRNLKGGDRDSAGALQQRPSQGWGTYRQVRNVRHAANKFYDAAARADKGQPAGQLAQAVQRSAYPDKYGKQSSAAKRLLKGGGGARTSTRTVPGVDRSGDRRALLLSYLEQRGNPSALLNLATGLKGAQDTPSKTITKNIAGGKEGTSKAGIVQIGKLGQRLGLHVGENPHFGGVSPVHVKGSYHYSGRAIDVSGSPAQMRRFANVVNRRYGRNLKELFYNGPGGHNIKNGKPVPKGFVGGHTDHVHVAE